MRWSWAGRREWIVISEEERMELHRVGLSTPPDDKLLDWLMVVVVVEWGKKGFLKWISIKKRHLFENTNTFLYILMTELWLHVLRFALDSTATHRANATISDQPKVAVGIQEMVSFESQSNVRMSARRNSSGPKPSQVALIITSFSWGLRRLNAFLPRPFLRTHSHS